MVFCLGIQEVYGCRCRILTALPVGYMADKYGRSPTVKVGSAGECGIYYHDTRLVLSLCERHPVH